MITKTCQHPEGPLVATIYTGTDCVVIDATGKTALCTEAARIDLRNAIRRQAQFHGRAVMLFGADVTLRHRPAVRVILDARAMTQDPVETAARIVQAACDDLDRQANAPARHATRQPRSRRHAA